jgi:transcriptional regulator with XRE-family HTH domain
LSTIFSDILKNALKREKKTQRWLAAELGVTPPAITKYLKGNPTLAVIRRIDAVLPLPELSGFLQFGSRFAAYMGKSEDEFAPEITDMLRSATEHCLEVLTDPAERGDLAELIYSYIEAAPSTRRAILTLLGVD